MTGSEGSEADRAALLEVLAKLRDGARDRDAHRATEGYAEDADWINAFGVRRKGKAQIEQWMSRLFADPGYQAARITGAPHEIRLVGPDVAVIHSYSEVVGQRTRSGQEMPKRRVHHFRVMAKEGDHWLIVSHIIMDEKDPLP